MVAPVPSQISSAPRNVRTPSTLNSFRILPVATGVGTLSPLVFQASSLPYPASSSNPRRLILLQTLLRSPKSQLLWNQANPNSLCKTRGVGGVHRLRASVADPTFFIAPLFSYSYKSLFPQPLSFHIHAKPPGCHPSPLLFRNSCLRVLCASVANPFFSYSCRLFGLSLQSFLRSFPLFSIACSLFSQNTGGMGIPDGAAGHPGVGVCVRNPG